MRLSKRLPSCVTFFVLLLCFLILSTLLDRPFLFHLFRPVYPNRPKKYQHKYMPAPFQFSFIPPHAFGAPGLGCNEYVALC